MYSYVRDGSNYGPIFIFGFQKSARKSNCIKPEMKIKLNLGPGRITDQFSFWLEKSGWKIKLHQTGNKK